MTTDQDRQVKFIQELTTTVTEEMIELVEKGRIPANWDGHELRQWLQDRFIDANWGEEMKNKRGKRYRDYRNAVIVNNL